MMKDDQFESYEKPTRVQRQGGKKKRAKDKAEIVPKEPYKRRRFNPRDAQVDEDDLIFDDFD